MLTGFAATLCRVILRVTNGFVISKFKRAIKSGVLRIALGIFGGCLFERTATPALRQFQCASNHFGFCFDVEIAGAFFTSRMAL